MESHENIVAELSLQHDDPAEHPSDVTALPSAPAAESTRGRPWAKGQSGNPRGRPSRAHKAAIVAQAMLDRKTVELIDRVIGWGQGSDKAMLRLYLQHMVPRRDEVPVWLNLPPIENRHDLKAAMQAVATGVASGEITSAHGLRLVQLFTKMYRYL